MCEELRHDERRRYRRMPVVWKATVIRLNGEHLSGSTDNVSRDGLNIILSSPLVLGEPLTIDLFVHRPERTRCFSVQGVTVYNDTLRHQLGVAIGVRLLEPASEFQQLVACLEAEEAS